MRCKNLRIFHQIGANKLREIQKKKKKTKPDLSFFFHSSLCAFRLWTIISEFASWWLLRWKVKSAAIHVQTIRQRKKIYNQYNWKINCLRETIQSAPDAGEHEGMSVQANIKRYINSFSYQRATSSFEHSPPEDTGMHAKCIRRAARAPNVHVWAHNNHNNL